MRDLILYIGMFAVGYLAGGAARRAQKQAPWTSALLTVVVVLLVFTMGLRIGANGDVMSNLNHIGLYALAFTVVVLVLSGIALAVVRRALGLDRYGMVIKAKPNTIQAYDNATAASAAVSCHASTVDSVSGGALTSSKAPNRNADDAPDSDSTLPAETADAAPHGASKSTLRILASVVCGVLAGFALLKSGAEFETVNAIAAVVIRVELCVLLVAIGVELGVEGQVGRNIREAGPRILAVPAAVIAATLAGAVLCSLFLPVSLRESLAIAAGFGWYSLAPGIIMDQGYLTAGAISFLHNILREILSIMAVPIVARHVGYIECTGLGGATTMDVGLPIVEQSTNGIAAVYSFVSGIVMTLLVPILVPLILTL